MGLPQRRRSHDSGFGPVGAETIPHGRARGADVEHGSETALNREQPLHQIVSRSHQQEVRLGAPERPLQPSSDESTIEYRGDGRGRRHSPLMGISLAETKWVEREPTVRP